MHARRPFPVSARASSIGKISVIWLLSGCHVCVPLRTFADRIPVRGRSPWLPFAILRGSAWASFGSSSCCFRSLRTRSIHLSLGLPRDLPPSSLLHVLLRSFRLFSSHGQTTKGVSGRHTCMVIGLTIASLLNFSFLIRSFLVLPWIHLSIFTSVIIVYASIEIDCHRLKYVGLCQVGLCCTMEMLCVCIKSAVSWLKMCILSQNTSPVSVKNPRNLIIDTKITKIGQKDT